MSLPDVDVDQLSARLLLIRAHLDERTWRLLLGAEAKVLGRGGIKVVAGAVKAHPDTVAQGVRELDYPDRIPGRVRRPGGGRPAAAVTDPTLWEALDALVDPVTRGDPVSAPAVDDEIDGETGRRTRRQRSSGVGVDGGEAVEGQRLQLAGEHENHRR